MTTQHLYPRTIYRDGVCRNCYDLSTDPAKPFAGDCRPGHGRPCNCTCHPAAPRRHGGTTETK